MERRGFSKNLKNKSGLTPDEIVLHFVEEKQREDNKKREMAEEKTERKKLEQKQHMQNSGEMVNVFYIRRIPMTGWLAHCSCNT